MHNPPHGILITGIHGLVGQYLFKQLKNWQGPVIITGKGACRMPEHGFTYEDLDITHQEAVQAVFLKHKPSIVIHSAAMAQPDACELDKDAALLVNVTATKFLLEAAQASGTFFLFLSTDFVFSGADGPYHEASMPDPVNFYGQTKWMAEQLVMQSSSPWAIVRTVLVYGNVISGTRSNIISWAKQALEKGTPIKVVGDQIRSTTYAGDLARAILTIAVKKASGVWHIAGKDALSPYEIALRVAHHLQLDTGLMTRVDASLFTQPARRPLQTHFIIDKAKRELGYDPIDFSEGMRLVLQGD